MLRGLVRLVDPVLDSCFARTTGAGAAAAVAAVELVVGRSHIAKEEQAEK